MDDGWASVAELAAEHPGSTATRQGRHLRVVVS
jgi:hypothetical protein